MKFSGKLVHLKEVQDEADEQLDIVKCENKNLADKINNVLDKLQEVGGSTKHKGKISFDSVDFFERTVPAP